MERAVELRLCLLALAGKEPDVEILAMLAMEQQKNAEKYFQSEQRNDVIAEIKESKMESVKKVAFGIGTDEEIERELRSKYSEIRRAAVRSAIVEEVTEQVWNIQSEEKQEEVIRQVEKYEGTG